MTLNSLTPRGLMMTPDDHILTLRKMLRESVRNGKAWRKARRKDIPNDEAPRQARAWERQAEALNWILAVTAYGVTEDEVVG